VLLKFFPDEPVYYTYQHKKLEAEIAAIKDSDAAEKVIIQFAKSIMKLDFYRRYINEMDTNPKLASPNDKLADLIKKLLERTGVCAKTKDFAEKCQTATIDFIAKEIIKPFAKIVDQQRENYKTNVIKDNIVAQYKAAKDAKVKFEA